MAYTPTLSDLDLSSYSTSSASSGYQPKLSDLEVDNNNVGVTDNNPPNGDNLFKQFMQNNNAAINPSDPKNRMSLELAANFLMPEVGLGNAALNALGRIGMGTTLNTALSYSNPNNNQSIGSTLAQNALLNTAIEGANPLVGGAVNIGGKLLSPILPKQYMGQILDYLGRGASNLEDNAKAFAQDVRDSYQKRLQEASSQYDPVLDKYGSDNIYPSKTNGGYYDYREMPDLDKSLFTGDLKDVFNIFNKNPTFQNAHNLQSQIGDSIGKLKSMQQTPDVRLSISDLSKARNTIRSDITNYLSNDANDSDAATQYLKGSELFQNNVVPYRVDNTLKNIALGKETNPKNLHNIFEYPTDVVNRENEITMGPINKVMADLSPDAAMRILYSKIGGHSYNKTPENVISNLENARQKGFSSYFSPDIDQMLNGLKNRITTRNAVDTGIGALLGHSGLIPGGEIAGGAIGYLTPKLMNALTKYLPSITKDSKVVNALSPYVKPTARALGAEYIGDES